MRISDWSSDVCSSDLLDTASARGWNLCGKPERFVEIDRVDQIKPRKLFLGFRKRAVGNLGAAIAHAHRGGGVYGLQRLRGRSEEHTSELQSLMRISYAVFCLNKKTDH